MTSPHTSCPTCGSAIPLDTPGGWCPACLMERLMGEGVPDDPSAAGTLVHPASSVILCDAESQPRQIGPYQLVAKIGEGGFGIVYRAEQVQPVKRRVAVKIIRPGMASAEIIARFEAERQALALMEHPNIARVYDAGTTPEGLPYFVMEFVDGSPLTTYCDSHRMPVRERLALFAEVCDAVQHAHQKAILHRDLKPSNVLVTEVDGKPVPKVIDFGIAKALEATQEEVLQASLARTQAGMVVGTPQYMSPEQAGSVPDVDTRSDVYTLGIILHELLTGQTPLSRDELKSAALDEVLRMIREVETRRPSSRLTPATDAIRESATTRQTEPSKLSHTLRGELDWIMLRALEKERERRYQSASLLAEDVRRYLRHEPVLAGPPQFRYRAAKFLRRNRGPVAAAVVIALTLIGATAFSLRQSFMAERAKESAVDEAAQRQELLKEAGNLSHQAAMSRLRGASLGDGRIPEALAYLARVLAFDPANKAAQATAVMALTGSAASIGPRVPSLLVESAARLCLSADGTRLFTVERIRSAAAKTDESVVFETILRTGFPRRRLFATGGDVWRMVAHPHGKLLALFRHSNVELWDTETGKLAGTVSGQKSTIIKLEFSQDGRWLATASRDHTARIWDAHTGRPASPPLQHEGQVSELMFANDNRRLMTAASLAQTCQLWEVPSGRLIGKEIKLNGPIDAATLTPDGQTIATAERWGAIGFWSAKSQEVSRPAMQGGWGVGTLKFSADGQWLLATYRGPVAYVWKLATKEAQPARLPHGGELRDADISPDARLVVTASQDKTIGVWDVSAGSPICEPLPHPSAVNEVRFTATGRWIVSRSQDQIVRVWPCPAVKLRGRQLLAEPQNELMEVLTKAQANEVLPPAMQASAKALLAPDATSGLPLSHWVRDASVIIGPGGKTIVARQRNERGDGRIWRTADWTMPAIATCGENVRGIDYVFRPDGAQILVHGYDLKIEHDPVRVFDAVTGQLVPPGLVERASLHHISISPDGKRLLTLNTLTGMQLWQLDGMRPLYKRRVTTERSMINSAVFTADGSRILIGSDNKTAMLCDAETGRQAGALMSHDDKINTARLSPDQTTILTASDDLTTRLWDAATQQPRSPPMLHPSAVEAAEFDPTGGWVLSRTSIGYAEAGGCFLWEASAGRLVAELPTGAGCRFGRKPGWLGVMRGDECRLVELPMLTDIAPPELGGLLELQAGLRIDARSGKSIMAETEMLDRIRLLKAAATSHDQPLSGLMHWWLENPRSRKVTPRDAVSVPDLIESLVSHSVACMNKTQARMLAEEAFGLDPLHPLVHLALALGHTHDATIKMLRSHGVAQRLADADNEELYGRERWARYARLAFGILLPDPERNDEQTLMLARTVLDLARRLEPASSELPAFEKRLQEARAGTSRASPRRFSYEYKFGDDPGARVWTRDGDDWSERSPSGKERKFQIVGTAKVDDCKGVIAKVPGVEFRVFIPDVGSKDMKLLARDGEGAWYLLGAMSEVE